METGTYIVFLVVALWGFIYNVVDTVKNSDGTHSERYYLIQTAHRCLFPFLCGIIYFFIGKNNDLVFIFCFVVYVCVCAMISRDKGYIEKSLDALTYFSIATAVSHPDILILLFIIQGIIVYTLWRKWNKDTLEITIYYSVAMVFLFINIVLTAFEFSLLDTVIILVTQVCIQPMITGGIAKVIFFYLDWKYEIGKILV